MNSVSAFKLSTLLFLSLLFLALMISSTPAIAQSTFGAVIGIRPQTRLAPW